MDFVVSGVITQVMQPQSGVSQRSGQSWKSQEFVLTYEQGQYPKSLCFRVFGAEKIQQFAIQQGEQLTIHLNITCQQSQRGGYFNSIDCWKVERQYAQQPVQQPVGQPAVQTGAAPFPPAQPTAAAPFPPQQQTAAPFPPQQQAAGQQQLPFPPAQ